jgi:glutamine synthetase
MPLPWRPEHGRVVQMFSGITHPDGTPFACDTRSLLKRAVEEAKEAGLSFTFGAEQEFYLFRLDENGKPSGIPCDEAGYMDIAPEDRGENIRREICLTLEQMGIRPESSHHEEGPGQNEIDFRFADPLTAADNAMTFQRVVKTVAQRNAMAADFTPKPLADAPGNGFHINMSLRPLDREALFSHMIAGILKNVRSMTAFLNPTEASYERLGRRKAPQYITWSHENRSQLIRIPAAVGEYRRLELRSADPTANPYLAFALMVYAGLAGIRENLPLCPPADFNLYTADRDTLSRFEKLPESYQEACDAAAASAFVRDRVPAGILAIYCEK